MGVVRSKGMELKMLLVLVLVLELVGLMLIARKPVGKLIKSRLGMRMRM